MLVCLSIHTHTHSVILVWLRYYYVFYFWISFYFCVNFVIVTLLCVFVIFSSWVTNWVNQNPCSNLSEESLTNKPLSQNCLQHKKQKEHIDNSNSGRKLTNLGQVIKIDGQRLVCVVIQSGRTSKRSPIIHQPQIWLFIWKMYVVATLHGRSIWC